MQALEMLPVSSRTRATLAGSMPRRVTAEERMRSLAWWKTKWSMSSTEMPASSQRALTEEQMAFTPNLKTRRPSMVRTFAGRSVLS